MVVQTPEYPVRPECLPPLNRVAGSYRLRFGRSGADLEAIQRLRFEVFNRELGEGLAESWRTGRDADPWDPLFHHLLIEHVPSAQVVGSYRLQTGDMAREFGGFYSEAEFDLCRLPPALLLDSVEIGRACVHAAHRNGRVLHLLWRGLAAYLWWNERRYLFGCCSLPTSDREVGAAAWLQLKRAGFISQQWSVGPQHGMDCGPVHAVSARPEHELPAVQLPPLFQSYLDLGAEVCGLPALDADFGTIDFFMVLDRERLGERTRKMFFRNLPAPALPRSA